MNQTVSNTVSVTASIIDLSGMATSNQIATVDVSGYPIQYTLTTNNTINVDSRYAPNGPESINLTLSVWPVVFNPTNPPFNQQIEYDTTASLPLDFENAVALVGSGDYSSTEAPANYFTFEVAQPCQTTITIKDLSNNVVMTSSQYVASPSAVSFSWNYTQANGVTPYTNSSYQVAFTVNNPPNNLLFTNHLTYSGVRTASGVIITYAEEDPSTADGAYINGLSDQWIGQTLTYLYENIYNTFSLTQYYDYQIGSLRNLVSFKADAFAIPPTGWRDWLQNAFLGLYSDLTVAPAHGSSTAFGANRGEVVSAADCASWCQAVGSNWRMRKVALWTCFSGKNGVVTNNLGFASAFGIPSWAVQLGGYMKKNAGLFVEGDLTFGIRWAEIGEEFDQAWVCGPDQYPGGCDPTWAINWANVLLQNQYSQVKKVKPIIAGYKWLPYTGIYDVALTTNSISAINQIGGK